MVDGGLGPGYIWRRDPTIQAALQLCRCALSNSCSPALSLEYQSKMACALSLGKREATCAEILPLASPLAKIWCRPISSSSCSCPVALDNSGYSSSRSRVISSMASTVPCTSALAFLPASRHDFHPCLHLFSKEQDATSSACNSAPLIQSCDFRISGCQLSSSTTAPSSISRSPANLSPFFFARKSVRF